MAQQTDTDTTLTPDDVIGKHIWDANLHMSLGVAIDHKIARNLHGEEQPVFICDHGDFHTNRFRNRDADSILRQLENDDDPMDLYEPGEVFDDVTPENYNL